MRPAHLFAAAALALAATAAQAQTPAPAPDDMGMSVDSGGKKIRVTIENLMAGQVLSPGTWFSHNASAPALFMEGKPASFGMMRIAEEGNGGPLLSAEVTKTFGGAFGSAVSTISVQPGMSRTAEIEVSREHPMISGAAMLVMTNDGFIGVSGVNGFALSRPVTIELTAMDAGTEKNNEKGDYLVAMMGTGRDPENGVVQRHRGIRGDADAPGAWKFDPSRPVARITFAPTR